MELHCYRLDDTGFRVIIVYKNETIFRGLIEAQDFRTAINQALVQLAAQGKMPE